jgi:predicted RecB family nuclease
MPLETSFTERTATELSNFLECSHRASLDLLVREKKLERPGQNDIERRLLAMRGTEHERGVLARYESLGLEVVRIETGPGVEVRERAVAATLAAMERGATVIYQGGLRNGDWFGRPDFLVKRVNGKETRWGHHYEVVDAKLAREAKGAAVLQLCSYTEQLAKIQGFEPEFFYIAPGGGEPEPIQLRVADYVAYSRTVRARFERFMKGDAPEPYPEPVEHCGVCPWWKRCEERRRADDHLSLVAGITRRQRDRLVETKVSRVEELAGLGEDVRVAGIESLPRLREQASLQVRRRVDEKPHYRLLLDRDRKVERLPPGAKPALVGLEALPKPTPGDLFLDLEGDAFFGGEGLEYLFGILELGQPVQDFSFRDDPGPPNYMRHWATTPEEEKKAFEATVDRIMEGREEFRAFHVFHFGHRESDALKKLSCRHKTREEAVDQLLREHVLVDLYPIARHSLIASVEGYTLKQLEALHGFERASELRDAARAMQLFGWWLETKDESVSVAAVRECIETYNRDDCFSTWKLRDWLEARRADFEKEQGRAAARPVWDETSDKPERVSKNEDSAALARRLVAGGAERGDASARDLMANLLDWHWREAKSGWWEYHRARELAPDDRLGDRAALAELAYEGEVGKIKKSIVHRYEFPEQEHAIRAGGDGRSHRGRVHRAQEGDQTLRSASARADSR